jgi:hypothetical protein
LAGILWPRLAMPIGLQYLGERFSLYKKHSFTKFSKNHCRKTTTSVFQPRLFL